MSPPAIIVHGGAGRVASEELPARLDGCKEAVLVGWNLLEAGATAVDAVEAAVAALEDNPLFNAGIGSTLNSAGEVEMDACVMEGDTGRVGAVGAVRVIKNPVKLARRIMEDGRHVFLVVEGAHAFAREIGMPQIAPETLIVEAEKKRWQEKHGTVGAVAVDQAGRIAAATSTGGIFNKLPGRIGDSPLPGCGTYANASGAASCTGHGEAIIRVLMGKAAVDRIEEGLDPKSAAANAVLLLSETGRSAGGIILVDGRGRIGYARNTERMPVAWVSADSEITTDS
jgi:beta-aspartyl-peptidase (threonine type)